jgi:hypothetical protein
MFAITNKYVLVEEATLDTREQKTEKASGHTDHPSSSKCYNKKRKVDHSINVVDGHNATGSTNPGRVNLKVSWIASTFSTPRKNTRPGTAIDSKILQMRCSRRPKGAIRRKSLKNPRATSLKLTRRSITSMVAPIHLSQGGSRNS